MIKFLRVDHRLLHGQVAVAWFNALDVNTILIANDEVANDDFRKSAIRLAKPEQAKLVMKSIADSIAAINSGVTDKYKLLIVVASVDDAVRLATNTKQAITTLNLGGTRKREHTKAFSKAVNLTDVECEKSKALASSGVDVFIQQIPNEKRIEF